MSLSGRIVPRPAEPNTAAYAGGWAHEAGSRPSRARNAARFPANAMIGSAARWARLRR